MVLSGVSVAHAGAGALAPFKGPAEDRTLQRGPVLDSSQDGAVDLLVDAGDGREVRGLELGELVDDPTGVAAPSSRCGRRR